MWSIAMSHSGAQGMAVEGIMPQVRPAMAGCAASTATKAAATNWRTFFIPLRNTILL
jgi:hypothetical protein